MTVLRDGSIPADNPFASDPIETRRPVWAEGLRNSVDFLFLPERWTSDVERCEKAGVPVEERRFRTKHEIALEKSPQVTTTTAQPSPPATATPPRRWRSWMRGST